MILTFNVDAEQAKALVDLYNRLTGEKRILIEAGKRYRRRDGEISGEIIKYDGDLYPLKDSENGFYYTSIGSFFPDEESSWDLIEEVSCNS